MPDSIRTPIYPLFILLFLTLCGSHFSVLAIILAQALVASIILVVLKKILDSMLPPLIPQTTAAAVIFFGLSPAFIDVIIKPLSEILLLLFTTFLFFLLLKQFSNKSSHSALLHAALIGILIGVMTLTKPVCQFLPIVPIAILALKKRLRECTLILAGFFIAVIPWLWRNHSVFGRADISTIDEYNLCEYTAKPLIGPEQYRQYQEQAGISESIDGPHIGAGGIGYFNFTLGDRYKACGMAIIKDHWQAYLKRAAINLIDFPLSRGPNLMTRVFNLDYKSYRRLSLKARLRTPGALAVLAGAALELLYRSSFYVICLLGIYYSFRSRRFSADPLLIVAFFMALYFIAVVSVTQINDFDQARLILPGQLALTFFVNIGVAFVTKRQGASRLDTANQRPGDAGN